MSSTSRLDSKPTCHVCGAGNLLAFNWEYAKTPSRPEDKRDLSVYSRVRDLRYGVMYQCTACHQPWYLCGEPAFMHFVPRERLSLIDKWNQQRIILQREHLVQLKQIGRTPPDTYGNGSHFHQTPCSVTTVDDETIDLAIVSIQRHAPFEYWSNYRLGSEIATLQPSPFALPLSVRLATAKAPELRMGFAPTVVELPGGEHVALNGRQSFFVWPDCKASEIKISRRPYAWNWEKLPPIYNGTEDVVYFIADP